MKLNATALFLVPVLIWGSTFFVIKFQLSKVDPALSVSYRFILAGIILLIYSKLKKLNLKFSPKEHCFILLQGIFLFGINYWLVYIAEERLISALVAVAFSTIIFLNILFGSIFLGRKVELKVFLGAVIGIGGTFLLFKNDLIDLNFEDLPAFHLAVCFTSVIVASLGNITSAYNQSNHLPVIQTNAFGMLYGGVGMGCIALTSGKPLVFDLSFEYISSLIYLAIFGSILAFGSYLTLIGKIGADRAAYVLIALPIIAVCLSILFEGYLISWQVFIGITLIIGGNLIVLRKKSARNIN